MSQHEPRCKNCGEKKGYAIWNSTAKCACYRTPQIVVSPKWNRMKGGRLA